MFYSLKNTLSALDLYIFSKLIIIYTENNRDI